MRRLQSSSASKSDDSSNPAIHEDNEMDDEDDDMDDVDASLMALQFSSEKSKLKPKLDRIFADVESNLPTINFDLSDVRYEIIHL